MAIRNVIQIGNELLKKNINFLISRLLTKSMVFSFSKKYYIMNMRVTLFSTNKLS